MLRKTIGRSFAVAALVALALAARSADALDADAATPRGLAAPSLPTPTPALHFTVSVPTITAVGSSLDEATLRSILSGDVADHADQLATLSAGSIDIPELHVTFDAIDNTGKPTSGEVTFHDVDLASVAGGIAEQISIGGVDTTSSEGGVGKFGKMSAENFDIGGLLAFYGLVKGDSSGAPKTIYRNLIAAPGTITVPKGECDIGGFSVAEFKARPLKISFQDFMALAEKARTEGESPDPETSTKMVSFFADVVDAVEVSPVSFDGFHCTVVDEDQKPVSVGVGKLQIGQFAGARYPSITAQDMRVATPGESLISAGSFVFKGMDFSGPLAAVKAAGVIDEDWLTAHYRELVPTFDGFSFSKVAFDVPDDENPGQHITGSIGDFDLTLKDYINGIPSNISTTANHIVGSIPPDSSDDFAQELLSVGITKFDIDYDVGLKWDEASQEIRLDPFSISGADLGSVAVASVIGQATRALFAEDPDTALAAVDGLTLKHVGIDMQDLGLADIVYQSLAKDAGKDVTSFRTALAGLTEGTMLIFLGGAADAQEVTQAVGAFINGAKTLSVIVDSKDPGGVPLSELEEHEDDPQSLIGDVDIKAHAK